LRTVRPDLMKLEGAHPLETWDEGLLALAAPAVARVPCPR